MSSLRFITAIISTALALAGSASAAEQGARPDSPFLPPPGAQVAQESSADALQLAGISVVGNTTFVSLFIPGVQRSRWIPVGKTVEGLEVVSCDLAAEQVVVRHQGQTKRLTLRKSAVGSNPQAPLRATATSGVSVNAPPAQPPPPSPPLSPQAEQEREARMFVSDLLEIGMQQRKAYEELQLKAAQEAAKKNRNPGP